MNRSMRSSTPAGAIRALAVSIAIAIAAVSQVAVAEVAPTAAEQPSPTAGTALIEHLTQGSVALVGAEGQVLATLHRDGHPVVTMTDQAIAGAIGAPATSAAQIKKLWEILAGEHNAGFLKLPIVKALAAASTTPETRDAFWSELAGTARSTASSPTRRTRSLLGFFERHRAELLPLLPAIRETEGAGDEMAHLMTNSQVFGDDIWQSLFDMVVRNPGAVARLIERERERGRPVKWEYQGFEGMMRWKSAYLVAGAPKAPRTLEALDAAGEMYITMFNALHSLNEWYRKQMLKDLGPAELFNAAVGGEQELYRLGTSGYRDFLHPAILSGIKKSGSFEAFIEQATPAGLTDQSAIELSRRSMIFLRIASSFGLLESVVETVRDREQFVAKAIRAVSDPRAFEGTGAIVIDVLTEPTQSPKAVGFKGHMLDRLYDVYRVEDHAASRSVYGSLLSVYQTISGDRREAAIDRNFKLDQSVLFLPFERLFKPAGRGRLVHRIFMRLHDDLDASYTNTSFRKTMRSLGASVNNKRHYAVYQLWRGNRSIEIYVNNPGTEGMRQGITDIANALRGKTIETIIGRGHTGIIKPLQIDSRRLLGDRLESVAAVIVGTCGGDASVRKMIDTFGYVPIIATKSTGRQVMNDAVIRQYIAALLKLRSNQVLSMDRVVKDAMAPFVGRGANEELRDDAKLYRVNLATVLAARLFDTHVRRHATAP